MTRLLERFIISSTPSWRVLLAIFAATPPFAIILVLHGVGMREPEVRASVNMDVIVLLQVTLAMALATLISVGFHLWPNRGMPHAVPAATLVVCLAIGGYYTALTIMTGTFTSSTNVVLIGVLAIGLLLFEQKPMLISYVGCVSALVLHDAGVVFGWWSYAPALTTKVFVDGKPLWWFYIWQQQVFVIGSLILFGLLLILFERLDAVVGKLSRLSFTDALTGLANRRRFMEVLHNEVARQGRAGQALSLVLIDADHFKQVNDQHGHLVGDEVLRAIGQLLLACVRSPTDLACRLGGEEFALLLPDTRNEQAVAVCERLRSLLAQRVFKDDEGHEFKVTVSMGVAQADDRGLEALLHEADQQMYRAKVSGRDRYCVANALPGGGA